MEMSVPSFYVLSEGHTAVPSSHDTSRAQFHHQDLAAFAEDVNSAAKRAFPNSGRSRYETVNVCLIKWEDDELGVQQELGALNNVLQDYGFSTNVFLIPGVNSYRKLMQKVLDFIEDYDIDRNLFVLYYAGHGRINSLRQAEWVFGQDPDSPSVNWSAIQSLFGTVKSDVLILLDTCAAASSAMTSQFAVIETIAACGFERRAPPPGEYSLTNTLTDVLRDWINKACFSAASLHTEILFRLKLKEKKKGREGIPLEWCVTPVHWVNTKDCKADGIELCRRNVLPMPSSTPSTEDGSKDAPSTFIDAMDIDFDDQNSSSTPLSSVSPSGNYKVPHVLITLQLEENQPLDARQCARWLDKFPLLAKWVNVEAVFPSLSTLMILSIPMPVWDMLPDHPACSFIGYVTGPRLGGLCTPEEISTTEVSSLKDASDQIRDLNAYNSSIFSVRPKSAKVDVDGGKERELDDFDEDGFDEDGLDEDDFDEDDFNEGDFTNQKKKRARRDLTSGTNNPIPAPKYRELMIGNEAKIERFYYTRFHAMRQFTCKYIVRGVIELLEREKPFLYPDFEENEVAPPWWPSTISKYSVSQEKLYGLHQSERIELLVHILKMAIRSQENKFSAAQTLGITLRKLEEVTEVYNPLLEKDARYLEEIFRLAKLEERYKNGEIDCKSRFIVTIFGTHIFEEINLASSKKVISCYW